MRAAIVLAVVLSAVLPAAAQQVEVGAGPPGSAALDPETTDLRQLGTFINPPILEPAPEDAQERAAAAAPGGFRLDLSSIPTLPPGEYTLFSDPLFSREAQLGYFGDYPSGARAGAFPPTVIALPTAFRWDVGPDGGIDMTLFSLKPAEWSDLDTWEKIGWVTARASAIAGAAIILDSLF